MSLQVAHELITTVLLNQILTYNGTAKEIMKGVKAHLLRYGAPTGTIWFTIRTYPGDVLIATSEVLNAGEIGTGNYWHGYVPFDMAFTVTPGSQYRLYLNCAGYSFSESAHISWCTDFGVNLYDLGYSPVGATDRPFDFIWWKNSLVTKGTYP